MFKDEFGTSPMILFCRKESTGLKNYWQARTALKKLIKQDFPIPIILQGYLSNCRSYSEKLSETNHLF
jgi:hypothetical protein